MRMKKNIVNVMVLGFVLLLGACETKKNDDSKEAAEAANEEKADLKKDSEFAVEATDGGLYEVQVATLAVTKATDAQVKQFAQMMVDDHSKVNGELKTLAGQKGIALPDVISEKCQKKYYDLDQKNKGIDFDKEYIDQMVKDHKDNIDAFEKEADKGDDAEIKSWAADKLAALRHHLAEAERIQKELGK